jgi:hypothetical protein
MMPAAMVASKYRPMMLPSRMVKLVKEISKDMLERAVRLNDAQSDGWNLKMFMQK